MFWLLLCLSYNMNMGNFSGNLDMEKYRKAVMFSTVGPHRC